MDCFLLQHHPLVPHKFINSSSCNNRYFLAPSSLVPIKTTSWFREVGFTGSVFDGSSKENQNGSLPFKTLKAEITKETVDFFVSDAEGDPDCPTDGFSSIDQALVALRQGKVGSSYSPIISLVSVHNSLTLLICEERSYHGSISSKHSIHGFMVKDGSGIISVGMQEEDLERLNLPLMSSFGEDEDSAAPSFTITVDAKIGVSSGVSASDRAKTVLALSSPNSNAEDFRKPGHVFPLKYRNGGVLSRAGHTEASVDLVGLAGYRRKRETLVERTGVSRLPTKWGLFEAYCYRSKLDGMEHVAVVKGSIGNGEDVLVRVHLECLTGDIFGSARCDCGNQLSLAMEIIEQAGRGVMIYLRGHEGRGIGLGHKLQAYNLQDQGHETVEANLELGFAADARDYGIGAQMLKDIGERTMRLMTNNPAKFTGLEGYGLAVVERVPVITPITEENKRYLETKRTKMGHIYASDFSGSLASFRDPDINMIDEEKQDNET
ncbi:hypothetical protein MKX01_027898 [Papaver californicum]|nr:hypothetical protein MKX01_027898 [Papaver californicum]